MTTNPIERLDVPREVVEEEAKRLAACSVLREALARPQDESDRIAYSQDLYLVTHPEVCSTADDYPGWSAWLADRIEQTEKTRKLRASTPVAPADGGPS